MSTTPKPYPLATKSNEVIPHDIAQPLGCFLLAVTPSSPLMINQLPIAPILAISNEEPVFLVFSESATPPVITGGGYQPNTLYCPPGTMVIASPSIRRVWVYNMGGSEDTVAIQLLQSWNSLGVEQQFTRV